MQEAKENAEIKTDDDDFTEPYILCCALLTNIYCGQTTFCVACVASDAFVGHSCFIGNGVAIDEYKKYINNIASNQQTGIINRAFQKILCYTFNIGYTSTFQICATLEKSILKTIEGRQRIFDKLEAIWHQNLTPMEMLLKTQIEKEPLNDTDVTW